MEKGVVITVFIIILECNIVIYLCLHDSNEQVMILMYLGQMLSICKIVDFLAKG